MLGVARYSLTVSTARSSLRQGTSELDSVLCGDMPPG